MKISKQCLAIILLLLIISFKGQSSNHKNILILNSYHNGLSWTDSIVSSIKREFSSELSSSIFIEHMDTKRYFSKEYLNVLARFYLDKYQDKKFDLIISTDNNAYDFLLEYKEKLFGDVPVLFCGLNSIIDVPKGYSGIFENTNSCSTIHIIENNHPDYKEIVVVRDYSTTGETASSALKKDFEHMKKAFRYRFIKPDNLDDLQAQLSSLSEGSIVFYLIYNRDSKGNYVSYEGGFKEAKAYCNVPIYCIWDFYLNLGAVGGSLITGRSQGKMVSEMAKKVLSGTNINDLPPKLAEYEYRFDHNQLTHFGIKKSKLPKDSYIINAPYNFVREQKEIFVLILTVLILLTIIITVMSINIHLRKVRSQKEKAHLLEIQASHENLMIAKEAAEESNRLKSVFLATMSHELRTPLNAVIGFSSLIKTSLPLEKIFQYSKIIRMSGKHLLGIIEDIFDISLIEIGDIKIQIEPLSISTLLNEVHDIVKSEQILQNKEHLDLILNISPEIKETIIYSDQKRIKQNLINLLKNALKFTNEGRVTFGCRLHQDNQQQFILFFVKDTGIGIPQNKQKLIFEIFRQADDSHTRLYGGTGLGLTICEKLTHLMGGDIWIESEEGQGANFYFTIPFRAKLETDIRSSISEPSLNFKNKTVLIAEDDETSFSFLEALLSSKGMKCVWVTNGKDAVDYCQANNQIDLLLMDINMPEMNGYIATEKIKKIRPEIPIIAQTAYAIEGDKEKTLAAGCDYYISKPINKDDLFDKILLSFDSNQSKIEA
ncbi:ATP-binding protein [Ancylomarina sp. YFZ004]